MMALHVLKRLIENSGIHRSAPVKRAAVAGSRILSKIVPDVPYSPDLRYYRWLLRNYPRLGRLAEMRKESREFRYRPVISVILPVYNPPPAFLNAAICSVQSQTYENWELCIIDDGSTDPAVATVLEQAAKSDARIKLQREERNRGIAVSTNAAIHFAKGEMIALLDHDDLLSPHALHRVVSALNDQPQTDVLYSDEDKINEKGELEGAYFKPDWCPESFLSRMYLCHLTVLRRELVLRLGGFRPEFEGGHLYDLMLRLSEVSERIYHIPDVLYHWRQHSGSTAKDPGCKPYVYQADHRALVEALKRRGERGEVIPVGNIPGFYSIRYEIQKAKKVSIIIASKDLGEVLERCLKSIFEKSSYKNFEIVLIDNGTTEQKAKDVLSFWSEREPERFRSIYLDVPFNFSYLCNEGVKRSDGDFLLFLNSDTEVITPDWLEAMIEQAQRPQIGAVGALLFYDDGTIQHAGAILGLGGLAAHSHRGLPGDSVGYAGQVISINNYLSVAATCLMCRREVFEEVGPFDEQLPGDYEDVDLCLKMIEKGYRNVYIPHVQLYHYESRTRGRDYARKNPGQQRDSVALIQARWGRYIENDPCYSPHLTRSYEDYRVR